MRIVLNTLAAIMLYAAQTPAVAEPPWYSAGGRVGPDCKRLVVTGFISPSPIALAQLYEDRDPADLARYNPLRCQWNRTGETCRGVMHADAMQGHPKLDIADLKNLKRYLGMEFVSFDAEIKMSAGPETIRMYARASEAQCLGFGS